MAASAAPVMVMTCAQSCRHMRRQALRAHDAPGSGRGSGSGGSSRSRARTWFDAGRRRARRNRACLCGSLATRPPRFVRGVDARTTRPAPAAHLPILRPYTGVAPLAGPPCPNWPGDQLSSATRKARQTTTGVPARSQKRRCTSPEAVGDAERRSRRTFMIASLGSRPGPTVACPSGLNFSSVQTGYLSVMRLVRRPGRRTPGPENAEEVPS